MKPFTVNGEAWRVARVAPGDPSLVVGGTFRLGAADPLTRTVSVLGTLEPPMLDKVVLHEISHAIASSEGLGAVLGPCSEVSAQMFERYAVEAVEAASEALGRPVCVDGRCAW